MEPSPELRKRLGDMAAVNDQISRRAFRPKRPLRFALAFSLLLVVAAALAYKLFHRSGEQAIQLIPADALLIGTLDTNPSPAQAPVFARIARAIRARGLAEEADRAIGEMVEKSTLSTEIRPYISGSLAFAIMRSGRLANVDSGDAVVF